MNSRNKPSMNYPSSMMMMHHAPSTFIDSSNHHFNHHHSQHHHFPQGNQQISNLRKSSNLANHNGHKQHQSYGAGGDSIMSPNHETYYNNSRQSSSNSSAATAATSTTSTTTTTISGALPPLPPHHNAKDADDLHAWSIFRQNLNANFSESALGAHHHKGHNQPSNRKSGANSSNGGFTTNGGNNQKPKSTNNSNIPLRESTVNNILSHPKYGAQLKNQDAFTYLRFGLPRVKATNLLHSNDRMQEMENSSGGNTTKSNNDETQAENLLANNHTKRGASAAINEELKRRFWNSESNLLKSENEFSDSSGREPISFQNEPANSRGFHQRTPFMTPENVTEMSSNQNRNYKENSRYNPSNQGKVSRSNQMRSANSMSDLRHTRNEFLMSNGDDGQIKRHQNDAMPANRPQSPFATDYEDDQPQFHSSQSHHHQNHHLNHHHQFNRVDEPFVSSPSSSLPPQCAKHPHLVVKDLTYEIDISSNWRKFCGFSRQKLRVLEDISFDIRGGELLAIMSTSANEGAALLNVLCARHDARNGFVRAEIYLNGVAVTPRQISRLSAYVASDMNFCPDMSARQALLFAGLLMGPAARTSTDIKRRTRILLEELNLGEIRHTRLSELTDSERKRLHIAMHLLLDTELLIIDQPLLNLDIFDAFFLVEYLRQWAMIGGRSVIMTMSPPTYEVFSMIHRVLLLSAGRTLFVGPRRDFLKYFSSLEFLCPPFKNPSDYYLDLVTLDDLSQEALLESSQRIEDLVEIHARRPMVEIFSSMPGPPAILPAPFRKANFAMQFLALWIRAFIFSFPYNVVQLFYRFLIALTLSFMIGGVYWQIRVGREQEYVWDRIGFLNMLISVGVIPVMISELISAHTERKYILSDLDQGFYSLPAYLLAKMLYSAPQTMLIGLAYALPACSMAGLQLHTNPNSLPIYLLLMLSYFLALRSFVLASVWICEKRSSAILLFGFIFSVFVLSSGISVQYRDMFIVHRWIRQASPIRWLHEALVVWEFEPNVLANSDGSIVSSFQCSRNPVIQQPNAILVRADCGFQTRANILKWFEYQNDSTSSTADLQPWWHAFIALLALYLASFIIGSFVFGIRLFYFRTVTSRKNGVSKLR